MIHFAGMSITGHKGNGVNDDRILINGMIAECLEGTASKVFAAVLDGVGGQSYGDEAARLAAQAFSRLAGHAAQEDIQQTVREANQAILRAQAADSAHARMATTVAGLALCGNDYIVFNLGDSRVYHMGDYFSQLTRDHTYRRMAQDTATVAADIPPELSHVITRSLGAADGDRADMLAGRDKVRAGDVFLLCSDGLHDVVPDEQMEAMLNAHKGPLSDLCKTLVKHALTNGSPDNISVILCRVEEAG